jgi:hypothetical protein
LVKGLMQCDRRFELQWLPLVAAILIAVAAPAMGQLTDGLRGQRQDDQQTSEKAPGEASVKYQIRATLTDYCPVEKSLVLHEVLFDFHNASCRGRNQVSERKTPTLPNGPLYRNVRIAGYHFIDWSEGHPSPSTRNTAKVEISKTATTISASGWLAQASCSTGRSGAALIEDTRWQAKVVPEVQLTEDEEREEPAVIADLVPPKTTAVLMLSASCASDREESLQFTVTPIVNGVAQPSTYSSPVLRPGKTQIESDATLGAASIHSHWSPQPSKGESELSVTIVGSGVRVER